MAPRQSLLIRIHHEARFTVPGIRTLGLSSSGSERWSAKTPQWSQGLGFSGIETCSLKPVTCLGPHLHVGRAGALRDAAEVGVVLLDQRLEVVGIHEAAE